VGVVNEVLPDDLVVQWESADTLDPRRPRFAMALPVSGNICQ
jgi:hypothetical protein